MKLIIGTIPVPLYIEPVSSTEVRAFFDSTDGLIAPFPVSSYVLSEMDIDQLQTLKYTISSSPLEALSFEFNPLSNEILMNLDSNLLVPEDVGTYEVATTFWYEGNVLNQ
mmetsp:Transcript_2541/g.3919  ORF Transcript_2541/g.3919 Transcript_2541/m.3919 type:complete len:110 (+) Transcript_2541:679-1008(+)